MESWESMYEAVVAEYDLWAWLSDDKMEIT